VKPRLILLAGLALHLSAGPAFALKNIEGGDIVAFAAADSPVSIAPEQWQDYRETAEIALHSEPNATPTVTPRALAAGVVAAQKEFLASVKASEAYRDYLAGDSCRVLAKLNAGAVDALLAEAAQSLPEDAAQALRNVVAAARAQIDNIERTARFRSNRDRTLFAAAYYGFIAGTIVAFLPPERRSEIALEDFGETISCKDAGRTG
jgi:hypothetical protein